MLYDQVVLLSYHQNEDYTHYFKNKPDDLDKQLISEINAASVPNSKYYIALSFDEMKIKESLVYNKYSGAGDKSKMMLSRETLEGLRITGELILHVTFLVKSFVEMTRYLLSDSHLCSVIGYHKILSSWARSGRNELSMHICAQ